MCFMYFNFRDSTSVQTREVGCQTEPTIPPLLISRGTVYDPPPQTRADNIQTLVFCTVPCLLCRQSMGLFPHLLRYRLRLRDAEKDG